MTDKIQPPAHADLLAIVEARAAEFRACHQQALEAAAAHEAAKAKISVTRLALSSARAAADDVLPKATVYPGRGDSRKVAIVKRTPSTVVTREIGGDGEQAWRKSKYQPTHWHMYPREKTYLWSSGRSYMTIDGGEIDHDD